MKIESKQIEEILLKKNYITERNLKEAKEFATQSRTDIVDYLLAQKLITKDLLGQALAEVYEIPYADLNSIPPTREQVSKIPEEIAKKHRIVIFTEDKDKVLLGTDDPLLATRFFKEVKDFFKGKEVEIAYSLTEDIESAFIYYRKSLTTRFSNIIGSQRRIAPEIIEEIVDEALIHKASDIHFEPHEKEVFIRLRIDGVLQEAGRFPKKYYENILNRVKVEAHLRIDDHFSAQDGAIRYIQEEKGRIVDLRVSVVPTLDGEKIAIRVLAEYVRGFSLSDLGLSDHDQELLTEASKKPFGMILVTGPTGSGKTTTLYAVLKMLNRPGVNVTTIEDPVEYKILGVNQIQVNPQTNLTFAKGLRSIFRQDPDIILVGEIRDDETAEIAVNAALTGHLMLSTFHANDAATAIPRLLEMNIEPFLLSSTLEVIIAQRLVRRICENCRYSYTLKLSTLKSRFKEAEKYFTDEDNTLYQGKGCTNCGGSGFKGRTAVFEFIKSTPEMKELILQNPSSRQVWTLARKQGSVSMFEDGIAKVKNGITTIDELLRVSAPPENNFVKTSSKKKA
ncbi:Flp pilus assembly complex ATPase component TadA [Candidatus Dojkabacteria bacterium]|nr:Flp pilus assembly complex ATPase component TadA [Candidatus Dojkabacteria bacterium]